MRVLWLAAAAALACLVAVTEAGWFADEDEVTVRLGDGGHVRGTIMKTTKGRSVYAFRGIPFAEPPTGPLRFKAPVAKAPWEGELDATKDGAACIQYEPLTKVYQGEENCLFVNVYTPMLPDDADDDHEDENLAVMVWLYGGAFMSGSSTSMIYNAGKLGDKRVVLVTLNYRVGPIGFLSTGDQVSPGNYGLLDQVVALEWVRENIAVFGGDRNKVTIFGESAGGASVTFHLFSPLSKGLFHRAIAQSGSATCKWAIQKEPLVWSRKMASDFGCPIKDNAEMIECLRKVPAMKIVEKSNSYYDFCYFPTIYKPVIDGHFISEAPLQTLTRGQVPNPVPYMSGVCLNEGALFDGIIKRDAPTGSMKDRKFVEWLIVLMLDEKEGEADLATQLVYERYYANVDVTDEMATRRAGAEMISHGTFDVCHYETIHLLAKAGVPTYAYSFDHDGTATLNKLLQMEHKLGVGHSAELFLQFQIVFPGVPKPDESDRNVSHTINTLFTNFAKKGNPTPSSVTDTLPLLWPASTPDQIHVFHIGRPVRTTTFDKDKSDFYQLWTKQVSAAVEKSKKTKKSNNKQEL